MNRPVRDVLAWLQPWEFSPALVLAFVASAWLFVRGCRVHRVGVLRQSLFWIGWVMLYLSMHTQLDYYAERMFFIHRLQHLVLHHLGPLLVMSAYPGQVMRAGLPLAWPPPGRPGHAPFPGAPAVPADGAGLAGAHRAVLFHARLAALPAHELGGGDHRGHVLEPDPGPAAPSAGGDVSRGTDLLARLHHGAADGRRRCDRLFRTRHLSGIRSVRPCAARFQRAGRPGDRRADHVGAGGPDRDVRAAGGPGYPDAAVGPQPPAAAPAACGRPAGE